ncbi:MAG TPA: alpha/beta fold hydrolase [Thiotrichales bacterium]|nr:alpha/beta fold hydrolase [Thiotrichales bacterium]
MNRIKKETRSIRTQKGRVLSAVVYTPEQTRATILIVPAIGASQKYYSAFALWLAAKGYLVATFDYSGMGQSLSCELKKLDVNVIDWAENDCSAMVEALSEMLPGGPLYWVGHSLGGQTLGFINNTALVSKAITIAAGSGYWRENSPALKKRAWLLWYFAAPVMTKIFGYFPGKRLNMVGDLPRGVIEQWRRWCLHPQYMLGVEGDAVKKKFDAIDIPITAISFTDDELMSAKNVASLHSFYSNAPKTMIRLSPQEVGVERIGHFGFFKDCYQQTLWQNIFLPLIE